MRNATPVRGIQGRKPTLSRRLFRALANVSAALLLVAGCGGGGGGNGGEAQPAPFIAATLISFPAGAVPPGLLPPGFNTLASVFVADNSSGAPLSNASVSVNGNALAYTPAYGDYEGNLAVNPGASVLVSVTIGGNSYTASVTQFSMYPAISAPAPGATWISSSDNLVSWSAGMPTANASYLLGVLDAANPGGPLVWPPNNVLLDLPISTTSYSIGANSLSLGNRLVIVGMGAFAGFAGAAPGSGIAIAGFNYVPVTVSATPPATLVSIAVTPQDPTVVKGRTRQLTATGTYSNSTTADLTAQVTWTSSDPAKVSVNTTGLATAVDSGSASITASSGSISGSTLFRVFVPTPSPAPPLGRSVTYQIDYAHSGRATFGVPLSFPSTSAWSVTLGGSASYPLIADGKVFVTTAGLGAGYGTRLYALDLATGASAWGPVDISGTYFWSGHAYDNGKIFVVNFDGLLRSFDAATGQAGWSVQLPLQYAFSSPPTAVNGIVYVGGAGSGGTLYAVDQSNGSLIWSAPVSNGDHSSPTVTGDGVFVSYPCQVYKFDPLSESVLWHYSGGCSGGGGRTSAYAAGLLYVRDFPLGPGRIFDGGTGMEVGSFNVAFSTPIPAFSAQAGFFQHAGTLQAIDLATHNPLWSFTGDGMLVSAPIVIDGAVVVGSGSGNVYALDAATGSPLWNKPAGAAISGPDEHNVSQPLTGFGAGEGYLVVPAGNVLTAWRIVP